MHCAMNAKICFTCFHRPTHKAVRHVAVIRPVLLEGWSHVAKTVVNVHANLLWKKTNVKNVVVVTTH